MQKSGISPPYERTGAITNIAADGAEATNLQQVRLISAIFRRENLSHEAEEPQPDPRRKWTLMYDHPLKSLQGSMVARADMKLLHYLPPDKRVASAVVRNFAWLVEELALLGHDCEVPDAAGTRPLHLAARYNHWKCVQTLLHIGVQVNVTTTAGFTPLYVARAAGSVHAAKFLENAGGLYELPTATEPAYCTCLDVCVIEEWRAMDAKARGMRRTRSYVGQY